MVIKDKGLLLGGLLALFLVVGLLVIQEIRLGFQYKTSDRIVASLNPRASSADDVQSNLQPTVFSSDPVIGEKGKQLFFFGDFTCEACKSQWQLLRNWQVKNPNSLSIVWKDTLDLSSERSLQDAILARCSGNSFVKIADELFNNNGVFTTDQYLAVIKKFGLNEESLNNCKKDPNTINLIQANIQEAIQLGLTQTPTVYINGHWYVGGLTEQELQNL